MRKYIRHPSDIPIEFSSIGLGIIRKEHINDIGNGGLCFSSKADISSGAEIIIRIAIRDPAFQARGVVAWSRRVKDHFDIGVQFIDAETEFGVRMIEQVCYIEKYRREIFMKEGRNLSSGEAAAEWIAKYAADFPR